MSARSLSIGIGLNRTSSHGSGTRWRPTEKACHGRERKSSLWRKAQGIGPRVMKIAANDQSDCESSVRMTLEPLVLQRIFRTALLISWTAFSTLEILRS